jgi:hypothetical protein
VNAAQNMLLREAAREELNRRTRAEAIHRQMRPAFRKALQRAVVERGRTDTPPLEPQRRVLADKSRLRTLCCSRRAGKTAILARIIAITLMDSGFDEWTCFGARTLGIAKDIMWNELHALNERYSLAWKMNDSDLSIVTARGGRFRLFGVNDRKSLEKVRGKKYRLVICDEASTYEEHLKFLIRDCFDPGTKDLDGGIILSGTPGYVKVGYWYEASQGIVKGWSNHHWTIRDNVYIDDVERKLRETREAFGYTEDHPTYITEYLGQWADNSSLLVCEYLQTRNNIDALPDGYSLTWRHVIGMDYGSVDACAWVVIAVDPYSDERFVVHDYAESGLIVDESVEYTRKLVEKYQTTYVVCDPGGGGKPFYETFNAKHGERLQCQIRSAEKTDLLGRIRLLNAELRTGRLKFVASECAGVTGEMRRLLWKDERKEVIVEGASITMDRFDAALYALSETLTWRAKDKPPALDSVSLAESRAREERRKRAQSKSRRAWFDR